MNPTENREKPLMTAFNKARVQKYRTRKKAAGCKRMELTLHASIVEGINEIAKRENMRRCDVVAYAFIDYYRSRNRPEPV